MYGAACLGQHWTSHRISYALRYLPTRTADPCTGIGRYRPESKTRNQMTGGPTLSWAMCGEAWALTTANFALTSSVNATTDSLPCVFEQKPRYWPRTQ
eukprot:2942583-Rhodomonas_salina.4